MVVCIDPHQPGTDDGTGASVSIRCSAFRSVQSADGTLLESAAILCPASSGICATSTTLTTVGWPNAKCSAVVDKVTPWALQIRSIRAHLIRIPGNASG